MIFNGQTPKYLFDFIAVSNGSCYNTRAQSKSELTQFYTRKKVSVTLSFPSALECNKLDAKIREIYHPFPDSKNHF